MASSKEQYSAPEFHAAEEFPDMYAVLQIPRDASQAEIKASWRHLSQLHPDKQEGCVYHVCVCVS